ncbi:hypothetical protein FRC01_011006 [Tulasnella sp. 417]|nr:hypothetical protein FRC01_011006 [Tulasnella sp. 417]
MGREGGTTRAAVVSQQPALDSEESWGFRNITILSQDEQRIWTIDVAEIAPSSPLLASVFAYSDQGMKRVTQDPCKSLRGLIRKGNGRDEYQLRGVEADDFDVFLTVLRAHPNFEFSSEDLKVAMGLASDWGFDALRLRAKRGLEHANLSEFDKLALAKRCKDLEWIREAYLALATRIAPLSTEEIDALGVKATTAVARARERVVIQRLRALPFTDVQQWKCKRYSCRQALRDAWVKILDNGGSPEMSNLAVSAVLFDEIFSSGTALCEICASDGALAKALEDRQVEAAVAEAAIEQVLGETTAMWIV